MKTSHLILLMTLGLVLQGLHAQESTQPSQGQEAVAIPPLPKGMLLQKRAPAFSQWAIALNPELNNDASKKDKAAKGEDKAQKKPSFSRATVVTKTKNIYSIQIADPTGKQSEIWGVNGHLFFSLKKENQSFREITGILQVEAADFFYDISKTDFPGFEWVSPKEYVGIRKVMNKECIVFMKKVQTLSASAREQMRAELEYYKEDTSLLESDKYMALAVAYVDLQTRLPFILQHGNDVQIYQFNNPPNDMLTPPQGITDMMFLADKHRKEVERVPARPY